MRQKVINAYGGGFDNVRTLKYLSEIKLGPHPFQIILVSVLLHIYYQLRLDIF